MPTASVITLTNATVGGTGTNQPNSIGATGLNGGGLYLFNNTHATLSNTVVTSNTLTNASTGYGGGAYVRQGSVLTATNSRIERHSLPSAFDGRGAGLYIYDATVTLSNTQVQTNTTPNLGAGVRMFGTSTLNVLGGSSFVNNQATGGVGGAIAATNVPDINVNNATFQNNFCQHHTAARSIWMPARWTPRAGGTSASTMPAATAAQWQLSARAMPTSWRAATAPVCWPSIIAGGDGGALYVGNSDTVQLYATSGQTLNLNTNTAGGDGGAAYCRTRARSLTCTVRSRPRPTSPPAMAACSIWATDRACGWTITSTHGRRCW